MQSGIRTKIYKYQNTNTQRVYFRGYCEKIEYDGERALRRRKSCKEVRETRAEAKADAVALKKQLEALRSKRKET